MQTKTDKIRNWFIPVLGIIAGLLIALLLFIGRSFWNKHRSELVENQKEQMLILTEAVANSMETELVEFIDDLALISSMRERLPDADTFIAEYFSIQNGFEIGLILEDRDGQILRKTGTYSLSNPIFISRIAEGRSIWQYETGPDQFVLVFKQEQRDGRVLGLVVDEVGYYEQVISNIHVGTNGYMLVKNSEGTIIMHPDKEQWGIAVIEGRKEMYPDLDYTSLTEMIDKQLSGEKGLSEYESYWWTDPDLPRVLKVAAYVPAKVGDTFWVLSAVIDYSDFYSPIDESFKSLSLTYAGAVFIFALLIFIIARLILEQRKAATEVDYLRELNAQLEAVQKNEEAIAHQQRLSIMGTMTGGIVHEFNNFLVPIMGYAELLMLNLPENSEEFDYANEIYDASEKAKELTRQLSTMSRRNVETVFTAVDAEAFLRRVTRMMQSICPENVSFSEEVELNGQKLIGSKTQLNQVLLNVFANAVQAVGGEEGHISLSASCISAKGAENVISTPVSSVFEEYIHIQIKDDGCGMSPETLRQIFEPFYTTKKPGEGTGLGLALVKQMVTSHRGYVCAKSREGEGSAIEILLPVAQQEELSEPMENENRERVFIVADDNAKILEMLKKQFTKIRIRTESVMNNSELMEILSRERADVLLIDETFGRESGISCCLALSGKYPDLVRILMADTVTREVVEAKQRGVIDDYIEKPVSDRDILLTVQRHRH
ncbi:MAG: response regulator [Lachnospiraceae bacterium]|nr:response regulator [Lachnospiraceae bacterium]